MKCFLLFTGMLSMIAFSNSAALKDTTTIFSPIETVNAKNIDKRELPVESSHGWNNGPSLHAEAGWQPEPAEWHKEPHTVVIEKKVPYPVKVPVHIPHTVTVEKPVHVYKPYIIEKKVHVPHEVIVEKQVPVFVERHRPRAQQISVLPVADSTLLGQSLVANRLPLLDPLVSGGILGGGVLNGGTILDGRGFLLTGNNILDSGVLGNSVLGGNILDSSVLNGGILNGGILNGGILNGGILNGGILNGGILNGGILNGGFLNGGILNGGIILRNPGTILTNDGLIV